MPIAPTEPPEIGDLPEAPSRFTDSPDEFSQKAEDWSDALPPYSDDVEAVADWMNETADQVYSNAVEANSSASSAAQSASDAQLASQSAEASANLIGSWADLTGSVSIGESVLHNSAYWVALVAIADITASEPGVSSDWAVTGSLSLIRYSKLDNPLCHLFKKNKLVDTLAGDLTWTRASTATYVDRYGVVQTAAIDEPREEADGWLVEGASTNLVVDSNGLSSSLNSNITAAEDVIEAPDGTMSGNKMVANTTNGAHHFQWTISAPNVGWHTMSAFIKAGTNRYVRVAMGSAVATIDTTTMSLEPESDSSARIEGAAVDGWHRVSTSIELTSSSPTGGRVQLLDDSKNVIYAGDGFSDVYVWGFQLEELPFATSYIPTTDAAATRAADAVGITCHGNLPGLESFSIVASTKTPPNSDAALVLYADELSSEASYSVIPTASNSFASSYHKGGNVTPNAASEIDGEITVTVVSYDFDTGELTRFYGGSSNTQIRELTGDAQPKGLSMGVGCDQNGSNQINGHIKDFRIYDFALNESEIKFLAGE